MPSRNAFCIIVLYLLGSSLIHMGSGGYHSHLALLAAYISFIPIILIIGYIVKKNPNSDIYKILGKGPIGFILSLVLLLYCFLLGARIIFSYSDFIFATDIFMGNEIIFFLSILLVLAALVKSGLRSFGRFSHVFFFIIIISIVILSALGFNNYDYGELLPLYPVYFDDFLDNYLYFLVEPFLESFLLINVITYCKRPKVFLGYIVGFLILLILNLESIALLGSTLRTKLIFPFYSSIGVINSLEFLNRIEVLGIFVFYLSTLIKLVVVIFSAISGMNRIFHTKEEKIYVIPIILVMILLSQQIKSVNMLREYNYLFLYGGGILFSVICLALLIKKPLKKAV